ncbi:MAG: hypothetical protein KDD43_02395 [Bdellovibrionales bacterium]|nr:hypothetical protein [Bdellovibrionales bacterium]
MRGKRSIIQIILASALAICLKAQGLCVSAFEANMRTGPGGKFPISWVVGRYTPLIKLEKKGRWYRVEDQDGEKHWISASLVTTSYQCVSVKGTTANLRSGPGTNYSSVHYGFADKYTPFKRVNLKNDWYQVEDESGYKFWVHNSTVWRPVTVSRIGF